MGDSTVKPDSGNDLVLSNNGGTGKIEVNDGAEVKVTTGSASGDDFTVNTTQLVVEGDTGNVGIGQATPTNKVEIVKSSDGGDVGVKIENSAGSGSTDETVSITAGHAGTVGGKIVFARHGNYSSTGDKSSTIEFYTADDNADGKRMTVEKGGDVTVEDGDLVIGTAGHGIDFSAQTTSSVSGTTPDTSSGAETLSHYETGTWTPAFGGGLGAGGSLTANVASATYVRIGTLVTVSAGLDVASQTSPTGDLTITGLPFANPSNHHACGTMYARNLATDSNMEAGSYFTLIVVGGDIYVRIGGRDGADTSPTYGSGKMARQYFASTSASCWFTLTYETS